MTVSICTIVLCLNFSSQFDYILYFSVSCFNISCLLKYEPKIDFLESADENVYEAAPCPTTSSSPDQGEYGGCGLKYRKKIATIFLI